MQRVYLILAVAGAIIPWVFFTSFFAGPGLNAGGFIGAAFANGAAGGAASDLLISSLVFWIYLWHRRTPRLWAYVILNVAIGLSCALPAYLYIQTRTASTTPVREAMT